MFHFFPSFFSPPLLLIVGCCGVFFFLLLSSASVIRLIERSHNGVRGGCGFGAVVGVRLYLLFITEINFYCRLCMCLRVCVSMYVRVFV